MEYVRTEQFFECHVNPSITPITVNEITEPSLVIDVMDELFTNHFTSVRPDYKKIRYSGLYV